eukprot:TRINITY_DN21893_c0_g1_i1.p1 TRINITY_DN21893_c0_g1~~TRINITY_DN21893_c0_g1_i1.p1  ORF type:complete len:540 (-),score=115.33 TRINITY_DN21893_c0_g1_i1:34-1653(-)
MMENIEKFTNLIKFEDLEFGQQQTCGNFGRVCKGEYLGLTVAIKELFFVDEEFMGKYFEREMATLIQLSHPNIVQLIGICITTDMFIVTEFIEGGNLRKNLSARKSIAMSWELRLSLGIQVCLGMTYLHNKHNMMHRDLKSANILVDKRGPQWLAKICDFGLAREDSNQDPNAASKLTYTVVGTNEWMAPEVALQRDYDKSSDVFSFGIVLWEIVTRRRPPLRKPPLFLFSDELFSPKIPTNTPEGLWKLIQSCCDTYAESRPTFSSITDQLVKIAESISDGSTIVDKHGELRTVNKDGSTNSINMHNLEKKVGPQLSPSSEVHQPESPDVTEEKETDKPHDGDSDEEVHKKEVEGMEEEIGQWEQKYLSKLQKKDSVDHIVEDETVISSIDNGSRSIARSFRQDNKIRGQLSKRFWNSSKPLLLDCWVENLVYRPGDVISVTIKIDNKAKTTVKGCRFVVLQKIKKKVKNAGNPKYVREDAFPLHGPGIKVLNDVQFTLPTESKLKSSASSFEIAVELTLKNHSGARALLPVQIQLKK